MSGLARNSRPAVNACVWGPSPGERRAGREKRTVGGMTACCTRSAAGGQPAANKQRAAAAGGKPTAAGGCCLPDAASENHYLKILTARVVDILDVFQRRELPR